MTSIWMHEISFNINNIDMKIEFEDKFNKELYNMRKYVTQRLEKLHSLHLIYSTIKKCFSWCTEKNQEVKKVLHAHKNPVSLSQTNTHDNEKLNKVWTNVLQAN